MADMRCKHRKVLSRNRVLLPDTPFERRARALLLRAVKIPALPSGAIIPVLGLIGAGEWEVAFTVLCTRLCPMRAWLGRKDWDALRDAGEHLGINTTALLTPYRWLLGEQQPPEVESVYDAIPRH